jgi:putative ABC transport system ATP-binding protein
MTGRRDERRPAEAHLVEVDSLSHTYDDGEGTLTALRHVDLRLSPGETIAVTGRTGSGKTTLLGILGGLERPTSGRVFVAGHDLARLSRREREAFRRRVVGYVWQDAERGLLPALTVLQNVLLPMLAETASEQQRLDLALQLLEALRLLPLAGRSLGELTAAETQRLALAVALANRPLLLLADELTAVLDWPAGGELMGDLVALLQSTATAAIVVSHDSRVQRYVDRVAAIRDGGLEPVAEGAQAALAGG